MSDKLRFRRPLPALRDLSSISDDHLASYVGVFNRRLTRRMASCRLQFLHPINSSTEHPGLTGGVKLNFRLSDPIKVLNCVDLENGVRELFVTDFRFSRKSTVIIPATNAETTEEVKRRLCDRFNILSTYADKLAIYEREILLKHQDICYRKLAGDEKPLELLLIWCLNQEKKSLILTDHDPNKARLANRSLAQLQEKLHKLEAEEVQVLEATRKRFMDFKRALEGERERRSCGGQR